MTLDDLQSTVIPFGKYKGKTFDQAPLSYLDWLSGQDWLDKFDDLRDSLTKYLKHPTISRELDEMEARGGGDD